MKKVFISAFIFSFVFVNAQIFSRGDRKEKNELFAVQMKSMTDDAMAKIPDNVPMPAATDVKATATSVDNSNFLDPKILVPVVAAPETASIAIPAEPLKLRTENLYVKREKGVAVWLDNDRSENLQNNFALHKTAPIGSIIKVRNPMNGRAIYVKVVGRLPDNIANENILIKLSKGAARKLNVLDEKFVAELMIPRG